MGFANVTFIIVNIAIFSMMISLSFQKFEINQNLYNYFYSLAVIFIFILIFNKATVDSVSFPYGIKKDELKNHISFMRPSEDKIYKLIRSHTKNNSDFLALVFRTEFYIKADRIPISGNYYYLPWQAAYNKASINNYKIDLCDDLEKKSPSVILFDNWKVWDKYSIDSYESCITKFINDNYSPVDGETWLFFKK